MPSARPTLPATPGTTAPDDPRTVLARERTLLARARVSLAFSLVTVALAVLAPAWVPTPVLVALGVLCTVGALVPAVSLLRR